MLSRFDTIPERDGQMDRQMDRIAISILSISLPVLMHEIIENVGNDIKLLITQYRC